MKNFNYILLLCLCIFACAFVGCTEDSKAAIADGDTDFDADLDLSESLMEQEIEFEFDVEYENFDKEAEIGEEEIEAEWQLAYKSAEEWGSYNIGAKKVVFKNADQDRELPGMIWYPTNDTTGELVLYQEFFKSEKAFKNASIADGEKFPVIVFSHGSTSFAEQSFYQTEFFASHGFIVAACNHIGNTAADSDDSIMIYMMQQRPRDISIVIDHLENYNSDENDPFFGKIDLDKIGAIGHSFGGFTVTYLGGAIFQFEKLLELCEQTTKDNKPFLCSKLNEDTIKQFDKDAIIKDDRIKAIVPQAPVAHSAFWDEGIAAIDVPVLMQIGELDETLDPYLEMYPAYDAMNSPKYMQIFKTGGHFTFSNMCMFIPNMGDGCGEGFLASERAYYLINVYSLAFMRYYLMDEQRDVDILSDDYTKNIDEIILKASR